MAVALVLIGLFGFVGVEAQLVSDWLRQRVGEIEVFVDEEASAAEAEALHARIETMPGVGTTRFITRDEAQRIFQEEFGEGAEIYVDEPFLPASVKVQLRSNYAHPDSLTQMAEAFQTWDHVDEVVFNRRLLVKVQRNLGLVTLIGGSLGLLVILASIFLVGNTIRLTIYARRLLIRTMKLVGATDAFVRRPFLVEGMLQGLLAGLIAAGLIWGLYQVVIDYLPQLAVPGQYGEYYFAGGIVLLGVVLGWLGSYFAVRRFIKNVELN